MSLRQKKIVPVTLQLPPAHPKQHELITIHDRNPNLRFVFGACGSKWGKLIHLSTVIPTTGGLKTVGTLQEGDYVFAVDGTPTLVEFITDVNIPEVSYEVTFSDGTKVIACSDHLWEVKSHATRKNLARVKNPKDRTKSTNSKAEVLTTQQIKDNLYYKCKGVNKPNYSIDNCEPVQFPKQDLILDPYVLGVWLGDGRSNSAMITQHVLDQPELINNFNSVGFNLELIIDGRNQHLKCKDLKLKLDQLNLINNKHIPSNYLIGSVEQRLALLQGLMDTDGTIDKRGHCTFDNTNKNLADGVAFLAASLGIKVNRSERIGRLNGVDKKLCYRVWFTTDLPVFRLQRKLERLRPACQKAKQRMIVSIEQVPSVPMKCIRVAHPRHLFLITDSFVPTHNTFGCTAAILKHAWNTPNSKNWWVAPTYAQSEEIFNKIQEYIPDGFYKARKADLAIDILDPSQKVRSTIEFKSAEKEASLRGFGVKFFIIDEAARISHDSYVSVLTTTTQVTGKGIIISTPMGRNWFYDEYQKGEKFYPDGTPKFDNENTDPFPEYFSIRMPTWENPTVPPENIEFLRRTMIESVFRQEIAAEFLIEGSGVFTNIDSCIKGKQKAPQPGHTYQVGLDLARKKDYTVIIVIDKNSREVVFFDRYQKLDWPIQYNKIKQVVSFYNNATVIADATGIGDPIISALNTLMVKINPYNISSNQQKKLLIDNLRLLIEKEEISIPRIPQLITELREYEYKPGENGIVKFSAPPGKHDDCVIALALACHNLTRPSFNIDGYNLRGI